MKDRESCRRHRAGRFHLLGNPQRRNTNQITELQTIFRVDAAFVDSHLAGAQDAVDMAFRHALGHARQKIVDALPFGFFADFDIGDWLVVRCVTECATSGLSNAATKWMA